MIAVPDPPDRARRPGAIAGTLAWLIVAPGAIAGLIPWLITGWEVEGELPGALRVAGAVVAVVAAGALGHAFVRFALEGLGTPAPIAPTARLVVGGLYRHVRNPMYLAVLALIAGQSLFFGSTALIAWGVAVAVAVLGFVHLYEEPTLARRYGSEYERYRGAVPRWVPRLRPWKP